MSTPEPTTADPTTVEPSVYQQVMARVFPGKRSYSKPEVDAFQREMAMALAVAVAEKDEAENGWRTAHAEYEALAEDNRNRTDPDAVPLPSRRRAIEIIEEAQRDAELLRGEAVAEATLLAQEMLAEAEYEARERAQQITDEAEAQARQAVEDAHRYARQAAEPESVGWANDAQPAPEDVPADLVDRLAYWENVRRQADANKVRADEALLLLLTEADNSKAEAARQRELAARLDQAADHVIARLTGAGSTDVQIRPSP